MEFERRRPWKRVEDSFKGAIIITNYEIQAEEKNKVRKEEMGLGNNNYKLTFKGYLGK